jgi:hypothetical protein
MAVGWSQSGGWESYEAWKRWFLQETGRVNPPPPHRPSVRLFGVYRVFSAPEGIQTEVGLTYPHANHYLLVSGGILHIVGRRAARCR